MIPEIEFYCPNCGDFRNFHIAGSDVLCDECNWVIAAFRVRPVIVTLETLTATMMIQQAVEQFASAKLEGGK